MRWPTVPVAPSIPTLSFLIIVSYCIFLPSLSIFTVNGVASTPCFLKTFAIIRPTPSVSGRSEEYTSELQSYSFISYAVFCLKKKDVDTLRREVHNEPGVYMLTCLETGH